MWWLLQYDVVDDYLERRGEFRDEHLGLATDFHERGALVIAGAFADPADGAALVFRATTARRSRPSSRPIPMCETASSPTGGSGPGPW